MKTLIINGSPRKNGDTVSLLNILKRELGGETEQINTCTSSIKPCVDCRYCWTHTSCAIKDEMQDIFSVINEVDNIVIASPIYFSELTGSLLNIMSRLQYFWVSENIRKEKILKNKKRRGIIILVGGGEGSPNKAADTASCLLHHMDTEIKEIIYCNNTNNIPASDNKISIQKIVNIAKEINNENM